MPVSDEEVQSACAVMERQARRLAARGLPAGITEEDLCSAGGVALARAARDFDPDFGFPFAHFAARCVRCAMLEEIRQQARRNRKQRPLQGEDNNGCPVPRIDVKASDPAQEAEARKLLRPMKKRSTVVLTQVRASSPAAAEVGQMVQRLRMALFGGISEQDVADVLRGLVERARGGNVAAARLLLEHIAGGRSGCSVQQAVIVHPPSSGESS
jgi:DNA-directed RNA polymerase specialized sigma24 family protein